MKTWHKRLLMIALLGWSSALYWHVRLIFAGNPDAADYTNKRNISLLMSSVAMNILVGSKLYTVLVRAYRSHTQSNT